MSIKYVKGDAVQALLKGEVDYLLHCCNCQNNFGSGIAKQIKEMLPNAYEADCFAADNGTNKLGNVVLGNVVPSKGVLNLYGQEYYGYVGDYYKKHKRQGNYGAIVKGFNLISSVLPTITEVRGRKLVIAIPYKFASDRAGCDWNIILELIEGTLSEDFEVIIYHLEDL